MITKLGVHELRKYTFYILSGVTLGILLLNSLSSQIILNETQIPYLGLTPSHPTGGIDATTKIRSLQPGSGDWIITSHIILDNEYLIFSGNIEIRNGGMLWLKGGTRLEMGAPPVESEYYSITVNSGGDLKVIDSTISAEDPSDGRYCIKILSGASVELQSSEISYAQSSFGIYLKADGTPSSYVKIKDCFLHHNRSSIILFPIILSRVFTCRIAPISMSKPMSLKKTGCMVFARYLVRRFEYAPVMRSDRMAKMAFT
jgi:hypothetical protein